MNQYEYYTKHSVYSEPKQYANLYKNLPDDIEQLTKIIRGLIVHQHETEKYYGFKLPKGREIEPNTRYVEKIIEKIINMDSSDLTVERIPEKRFIGLCRDFALMLCSILRSKGIPARIRCGFANYFHVDEHVDHWLCEFWDKKENRWILVDTEVDEIERKSYSIPSTFNNLDVTKDEFWLSSKAWEELKKNPEKEKLFGVTSIDIVGAWFVRANLFRDLAALNKIELCPWDYTEYSDKRHDVFADIDKNEIDFLDSLAEAINSVYSDVDKTIDFYKNNPNSQVKDEITSYTNLGPVRIKIDS